MTRQEIDAVAELRSRGMTWKVIAGRLGYDSVAGLRKRMSYHQAIPKLENKRVVMANLRFSKEHHDAMRLEAHKAGMTVAGLLREIVCQHFDGKKS